MPKMCRWSKCQKRAWSNGYCREHYKQAEAKGILDLPVEPKAPSNKKPRGKAARDQAFQSACSKYLQARKLYLLAVGTDARTSWWKQAESILREAEDAGMDPAEIRKVAATGTVPAA